ncbi:hypothetical protein TGCAST_252080 [Toxoplasma gondii CAST]|uniref:Uncharacterized protein n=1 Tax=Toxoplasma gondii CAST TaxID=943122 RepID=A0A3R8AG81_TOXGO|nr:hypothetical protein TGCAST_252080 [Toxoplasma gondii CAST]
MVAQEFAEPIPGSSSSLQQQPSLEFSQQASDYSSSALEYVPTASGLLPPSPAPVSTAALVHPAESESRSRSPAPSHSKKRRLLQVWFPQTVALQTTLDTCPSVGAAFADVNRDPIATSDTGPRTSAISTTGTRHTVWPPS